MTTMAVADGDPKSVVEIAFTGATVDQPGVFYVPVPTGIFDNISVELWSPAPTSVNSYTMSFGSNTITRRTLKKILPIVQGVVANDVTEAQTKLELEKVVTIVSEVSHGEIITIPNVSGSTEERMLSLDKVADGATVKVQESTSTGNKVDAITLSVPNKEGDARPSVEINMPNSTVMVTGNGGEAKYVKITASTKENTLVVNSGVTIEELEVNKGNVDIYGKVVRINNQSGAKITVILYEGADTPLVMQGSGEIDFISPTKSAIINVTQNKNYTDLQTAINESASKDLIRLLDNINLTTTLTQNDKNITLDLNGFDIKCVNRVITVEKGSLNIIGKGVVEGTEPTGNFTTIKLVGSNNAGDIDYTTLTIGKAVTINGASGIGIFPYSGSTLSYGVKIDIYGSILPDKTFDYNGNPIYGFTISTLGTCNNIVNSTVVNIHGTAKLISKAASIYAAGYGVWNRSEERR